ncbi:MAG: glycosyltransferase family 25 protein [Rickettsiaceae bacterium]|nr:glycosyltransferase family 25 protein [Rickettsiaceae bacterium]
MIKFFPKIKLPYVLIFLLLVCSALYFSKPIKKYFKKEIYVSSAKFDNVYVLSLDRKPERYEKVSKELAKVGLEHQRFSASDGYSILAKNLATGEQTNVKEMWDRCKSDRLAFKEDRYEIECSTSPRVTIISGCNTPGEIGVFCSTKRIFKDIKDNGYKIALILEDDVTIKKGYETNFKSKIFDLMFKVSKHFDAIYLHAYFHPNKVYPIEPFSTGPHELWAVNENVNSDIASGAAFIVTDRFVDKILPSLDVMELPSDILISREIDKAKGDLKVYISPEYIIGPDQYVKSTISEMGRNDSCECK